MSKKLVHTFLIFLLLIEIICFLYLQTNMIKVKTQVIEDEQLARIFDGLTVIHISDLHTNRIGTREKKLLNLIYQIDPDLVFMTGDFISNATKIAPMVQVVNRIANDRLVIVIPGNKDHQVNGYKNDKLFIKDIFNNKDVVLLVNDSIKLTVQKSDKKDSIYIVGLDDNFTWNDDFFTAMLNVPVNAPKILLAHAPNIVEKINLQGINLILSGHTHGGQIRLPFVGPLILNPVCNAKKKFVSGLYIEDGAKLYVNRGIGTSVVPLRMFCRPEITLFNFVTRNK
ncbi:MAG: metallophosphoesterase [Candidatus Marinimicrobia bacterium]|nr:metallophosphoesterase [Candidatus Neomarinimicrobiota bacterium]